MNTLFQRDANEAEDLKKGFGESGTGARISLDAVVQRLAVKIRAYPQKGVVGRIQEWVRAGLLGGLVERMLGCYDRLCGIDSRGKQPTRSSFRRRLAAIGRDRPPPR